MCMEICVLVCICTPARSEADMAAYSSGRLYSTPTCMSMGTYVGKYNSRWGARFRAAAKPKPTEAVHYTHVSSTSST